MRRTVRSSALSSILASALAFFSADFLKKCALLALHVMAEERREGDGFQVPELRIYGKKAAQSGRVKAKLGRKTKVCLPPHLKSNTCNDALRVIGLFGFGDKISLFLKDSELTTVALSCHMLYAVSGNE